MPELTATVDTESETVEITVTDGNQEVERIESDVDILTQNQQFVTAFERPILTLLTLYERERQQNVEGVADADLEDLPVE
jgi:hypothetical protein